MIVEIITGQMVGTRGPLSWQYWITFNRRCFTDGSRYRRLMLPGWRSQDVVFHR